MNLAELCDLAPDAGDALALRGRDGRTEYVITGEVAGATLEGTPADSDRVLEFAVDEFLSLADGETAPQREYLVDLPPIQHNLRDTPRPAPLPALVFREEEPLGVSLPTPTWRGSRVSWYDTRPEGTLVDLTAGAVVDSQTVLPDTVTNEVRL